MFYEYVDKVKLYISAITPKAKKLDKATIDEINAIIAKLVQMPQESINIHTKLNDMMRFDSLMLVELFLRIEEKFDIKISQDSTHELETVGDIYNLVARSI